MRNLGVLLEDLLVRVELAIVLPLRLLREGLLLHHFQMVFAFSLSEILRSVVVILNVRDGAAKGNLDTMLSSLDRVSYNVTGRVQDLSWVFGILIVLFDVNKITHMFVCGFDLMFNMRLELETFLVSRIKLRNTVLLASE